MKKLERKGKWWDDKEIEELSEKWGRYPLSDLARQFGRSTGAIKHKAKEIGLGFRTQSVDGVSMKVILSLVLGRNVWSKDYRRFMNAGLPYFTLKTERKRFYLVNIDKFWKWAQENQGVIDVTKIEPLALGKEPKWVGELRRKRRNDMVNKRWEEYA